MLSTLIVAVVTANERVAREEPHPAEHGDAAQLALAEHERAVRHEQGVDEEVQVARMIEQEDRGHLQVLATLDLTSPGTANAQR